MRPPASAAARSAAERQLLLALPALVDRAPSASAPQADAGGSRVDAALCRALLPDSGAGVRLVVLLCEAEESVLGSYCVALRERCGVSLSALLHTDQLGRVGVPPSVVRVLLELSARASSWRPSAVELAELACEVCSGTREAVMAAMGRVAHPSVLGAFVGVCERQWDAEPCEVLRARFEGGDEPLEWLCVKGLLGRCSGSASADESAGSAAQAASSTPSAVHGARELHAAGKGLEGVCGMCGTDEDAFIDVIGFADAREAAALRYEYAMRYGHTLASAVRDELSGELASLLLAFLEPPPAALAPLADHDLASKQAAALRLAAQVSPPRNPSPPARNLS